MRATFKKYQPIIAVFVMTFLMAVSAAWAVVDWDLYSVLLLVETFIALTICVLAILKLQDIQAFKEQFMKYDIVAQKFPIYATIYPFAEAFVGIGLISALFAPVTSTLAVILGLIGSLSIVRVINNKEDLNCACVGGNSKVPLGFVSLFETITMFVMGLWMLRGVLF